MLISRKRKGYIYAASALLLSLLHATAALNWAAINYGQEAPAANELAKNGGFEESGEPAPAGWFRDTKQNGKKGSVSIDQARVHSGRGALKLQPNNKNTGDQPLGIAQIIPAGAFRGQKLTFSGYMTAEGGATAALGMLSSVRGKLANIVMLSQPSGTSDWTRQEGVYEVPDDPTVQLILTCYVAGQSGAAWFDEVSVRRRSDSSGLTAPPRAAQPTPAPAPAAHDQLQAKVEVDAADVLRRIPRTLYGTNVEWIWNGNFLWQERERRPHPEAERLARELGVTLIRYPGGLYSDFYHWKDGVGAPQKRPEVRHEAGKNDRSRPNFGTDEVLSFAAGVGSDLLFTVNAGTGTPQEAAEWVRYVNRDSTRVHFWEVGNELYINDGSPTSKAITVNPSTYADRFRRFAQAMREADPRIKIAAIGGENQGRYAFVNYPDWNRTVLERAGEQMDFLAVHNAYAPGVFNDDRRDLRTVYMAMLAAPQLFARNLKTVSQQIDQYAPGRAAARVKLAVTEWGPLFQFNPQSGYVDHGKTLGSALFVASMLKAFIESPRTEIANFFLLNDVSVLGWIGSRNDKFPPQPDWTPTARYYAFQLYTKHFGEQLVRSDAASPTYNSEAVGIVDAVRDVPYLDVVASLSADGGKLYIMAINKNFSNPVETAINLRSFVPRAAATAWTLTGAGVDAHTGTLPLAVPGLKWGRQVEDARDRRFSKGGLQEVALSPAEFTVKGPRFTYRFPPCSVTSIVLTRGGGL